MADATTPKLSSVPESTASKGRNETCILRSKASATSSKSNPDNYEVRKSSIIVISAPILLIRKSSPQAPLDAFAR